MVIQIHTEIQVIYIGSSPESRFLLGIESLEPERQTNTVEER